MTIRLGREKSRFFARLLANALGEISRLEDLCKEGQQFLCVSQGDIQRVVILNTSGTTGSPKCVYFTKSDQKHIANQALLAIDSKPSIQVVRQARVLDNWIRVQEFDVASAGSLAK